MAYVSFKRGTQANIEKYLSTYTGANPADATEGTFYLTSDTNRLYVGKDVGAAGSPSIKAVPLNQGVHVVDDASHLPSTANAEETGGFYYITNGNILAIATGNRWVQINVNTNDDHFIDERSIQASAANNVATVTDILYNNNGHEIQSTYSVAGANGLSASVTPVYEPASVFKSSFTYYTRSGNTYTQVNSPTESGLSNYYIQRGYAIVLTPSTYGITATESGNALTLTVNDDSGIAAHSSSVTLNGGDNVTISTVNSNLVISAVDTKITNMSSGTGNGSYSSNGSAATQSANGFYFTATVGATKGASIDPMIRVGTEQATYETVHFSGGTALLPVYTKTEVDNKMRLFNAMEYQGTIASSSFPPATGSDPSSTGVQNGYVWMASDEITVPGNTNHAFPGDLIIAQGTEGADGNIPSNSITWSVISGGANYDTQTLWTAQTHGFTLAKSTRTQGNQTLGTFQIVVNKSGDNVPAAEQYLTATDEDNGTTKVVRIIHKEQGVNGPATTANTTGLDANGTSSVQGSKSNLNIPVPVISYDKAGHITGITTYQYTVVDTHATITNSIAGSSSATTAATITSTVTVDGADKVGSMQLKSSTINFYQETSNNTATGNIFMEIEWGTFN